jgi:hypothetical protein
MKKLIYLFAISMVAFGCSYDPKDLKNVRIDLDFHNKVLQELPKYDSLGYVVMDGGGTYDYVVQKVSSHDYKIVAKYEKDASGRMIFVFMMTAFGCAIIGFIILIFSQ